MKSREKNLLRMLLLLAAVLGGVLLSQRLLAWQRQLTQSEETLGFAETESQLMLAEEPYWNACAAWLSTYLTKAPSELEANQKLLESLRSSATSSGLSITKTQIEPVTTGAHFQQFGVTLGVRGALPQLFRWIYAHQSPQAFYAVPTLRILPDKDDAAQVTAQVQFWRWYGLNR